MKGLVRLVVESVETRDRHVTRVVIFPAARPFFADDGLLMAPPDGLQPPSSKTPDPLEWYAGALPDNRPCAREPRHSETSMGAVSGPPR